ncbi:MAG: LytTR family DNA-binding domain-containing protein [Flavobacteriaceae bacterium]
MKSTPIQIVVADDEELARKRIVKFLKEDSRAFKLFEASNGKEALELLHAKDIQLLFLDIKMTDMNGFEVLSYLPENKIPIVIFVTAFDDFAVKAFEVRAIDFLLKPYKKDRFQEALQRGLFQLGLQEKPVFNDKIKELLQVFESQYITQNNSYWDKIVLKEQKRYFFIEVETICYIQSSGYYAEIITEIKQKHLYRISLTDLMENLNPQHFSRINRSTIINRNFLKEIVSEGLGDFSIVMKDETYFTLSKSYKEAFFAETGIK